MPVSKARAQARAQTPQVIGTHVRLENHVVPGRISGFLQQGKAACLDGAQKWPGLPAEAQQPRIGGKKSWPNFLGAQAQQQVRAEP